MAIIDSIIINGTEYEIRPKKRPVDCKDDSSSANLNIGDEEGNVVAQFEGGHVRTKKFDSRDIPDVVKRISEEKSNGWIKVTIDKNNKIVEGLKKDGTAYFPKIESPTIDELRNDGIGLNILFIGDSYTQMAYWVQGLQRLVNIKNIVNLGTSSGHLKDNYSDRVTYPYVDRIYQGMLDENGSIGNVNTFGSEVEWIKRLNAGNLRGPLYQIIFTDATSSGTVTVNFPNIGEFSVSVSAGMTASEIPESFAQKNITNHRLMHPSGQSYVDVESMTDQYTSYPTITATGATASISRKRSTETTPFDGEEAHIVIIAGGKNDSPDSDAKVESYQSQVVKKVNGYVTSYNSAPTQRDVYIQTPEGEVDRTCFAGTMRHIMLEIHAIYPNAIFIFVGTSGISAATTSIENDVKKDSQCALAASYLSLPYVSWVKDGNVNRLFNYPSGDGTLENPWNATSATEDTADMLHPNQAGALKLAVAVAAKINEWKKYIKLINE